MLKTLLWKEIINHLMTFRFAAATVTTFALIVISVWVLGDDYLRRMNAYNLAVENAKEANVSVLVPSQVKPFVHRKPATLSIFAQGEDRRLGNTVQIDRWEIPRKASGSFNDNMLLSSEPPLDLFTVFSIVISLFGILLTYDAISGEREAGTLKLQCSMGLSRTKIFGIKFLADTICLSIPFLISLLSGLILLVLIFGINFSSSEWLSIGLISVSGLVYGGLFVATGLLCSALFKKSSTSLIFSLLIWTLFVLLIPALAYNIAGFIAPLPTSSEIANMEESSLNDAAQYLDDFGKKHPRYWSGYVTGGWTVPGNGRPFKFDGNEKCYYDSEEWVHQIELMMQNRAEQIWDAYRRIESKKEANTNAFESISFLSPVHHLRNALTSLANTNFKSYDVFMDETRRYRRAILADFQKKGFFSNRAYLFFSRRPKEEITDAKFMERAANYQKLMESGISPREVFDPEKAWGLLPESEIPTYTIQVSDSDIQSSFMPILILVMMIAIVFTAGMVAFLRYDIR